MALTPLTAISPIDGRYHPQTQSLSNYFSEAALMQYRLKVEVEYLIALSEKGFCKIPKNKWPQLRALYEQFTEAEAQQIKDIERTTNHDVKAVEYFLKQALDQQGLGTVKEWVHFGLTSQDINNTAIPLLWKDAIEREWLPAVLNLQLQLGKMALQWKNVPMLARTHGQPASPTRLGKELFVFTERIESQIQQLSYIPYSGKFGGATGNFNAHVVAFPKTNWHAFADRFLEDKLGIQRQQYTTQIEHYDNLAAQFDAIKRIHTILIDACRDIWTYISLDYFKQTVKKGEVGSSAMPHKV
ncbi:MAG TPA: lyase family protein, partial [Ferruginibacter sp.]|nr:lyase family protein [Ferruginibacter sp.]